MQRRGGVGGLKRAAPVTSGSGSGWRACARRGAAAAAAMLRHGSGAPSDRGKSRAPRQMRRKGRGKGFGWISCTAGPQRGSRRRRHSACCCPRARAAIGAGGPLAADAAAALARAPRALQAPVRAPARGRRPLNRGRGGGGGAALRRSWGRSCTCAWPGSRGTRRTGPCWCLPGRGGASGKANAKVPVKARRRGRRGAAGGARRGEPRPWPRRRPSRAAATPVWGWSAAHRLRSASIRGSGR
jgi:hypothetical protein